MCPPVCISWLLVLLPVVTGRRHGLLPIVTEGRRGLQSVLTDGGCFSLPALIGSGMMLLPVSTGGKLVLLPKVVGGELVPLLGVVVDGEHVPPLALAGNRHVLLSAPAADGHILQFAIADRRRGLLLA